MTEAWYDEALQVVAQASGRSLIGQVKWLAFCGHRAHVLIPCDDRGPLGVIRRWSERAIAEQELATLTQLHAEEPGQVLATFPKPLALFERGQSLVSVQSWLSGAPMRVRSGRAGATAATSHLSSFARWLGSRIEGRALAPLVPNHVTDTLTRRIARRTPDGPAERELRRFQQGLTDAMSAERGVLHNDLNPGNLLLDALGHISGVLDWEHAGPGPLLCDWVCFVGELSLALCAGNRHTLPSVQRALDDAWYNAGWLRDAVSQQTRRVLATSRATSETRGACWRLATFHIAYAWVRDEGPAAQLAVSEWLKRPLPDVMRD